MGTEIDGFGVGLVRASRQTGKGLTAKYDAVEGVTAFYLLFYPRRCLHVLEFIPDSNTVLSVPFRFVPLRNSSRIMAKAYLNSWGNVFSLFGFIMTFFAVMVFSTMQRKFGEMDRWMLEIAIGMLVFGVIMKLIWYGLERRDSRIRAAIGVYELGASDPFYWRESVTNSVLANLPEADREIELIDLADREFSRGKHSLAMIYLRMAMGRRFEPRADEMLSAILRAGLSEPTKSAPPN